MDRRIEEMLLAAKEAYANAYAPFSRFQVGCAVRFESGRVYSSYGVTICAERIAIGAGITAGERKISELLVVTDMDVPARPCGVCRQTIVEFGPETTVYLANNRGKILKTSATELLPHPFIISAG